MKAAIYTRYSSENQKPTSTTDQVNSCKRYAEQHCFFIDPRHIYCDEALSGALASRPALEQFKIAARQKEFDVLIVDDLSRLFRDKLQFTKIQMELEFYGITLHSVSDGIVSTAENSSLLMAIKSMFNEQYLTDLRHKTLRGQRGQAERGSALGSPGYGYRCVPVGDAKPDSKGRIRAESFKFEIIVEEAAVIRDIFELFGSGISCQKIAKTLNEQGVATRKNLRGGWNSNTIGKILDNAKYIGKLIWGKSTSKRNPLTGKKHKLEKSEGDWIVHDKPEMQIISDDLWRKVRKRKEETKRAWRERHKGQFGKDQSSYVKTNPPSLFSGNLVCGACGGSIGMVSGKGSGFFGCLSVRRGKCTSKKLISRKRLEQKLLSSLIHKALLPEKFEQVLDKVKHAIQEENKDLPDRIHFKQLELAKKERNIRNLVEYMREGRAPVSLISALSEDEAQAKRVKAELEAMERTKDEMFTPPPREWIEFQLNNIN